MSLLRASSTAPSSDGAISGASTTTPPVELVATSFGAGWSTPWDQRLERDGDNSGNVVVTLATGLQYRFGQNPDGSYAPPKGQNLTLVYDATSDRFVLRDRIVPIVLLAELMKLPERSKDESASRLFLVIEAGGRMAAVEIDAIRDRLDVVLKPMQGLLAGARGYAGTTLLADGRVLLVLDVKEILP